MYSYEIETRYAAQHHPEGGVAPSRHALALHSYLERQKEQAMSNATMSPPAALRATLSRSVTSVTTLLGRIGAFWSGQSESGFPR